MKVFYKLGLPTASPVKKENYAKHDYELHPDHRNSQPEKINKDLPTLMILL